MFRKLFKSIYNASHHARSNNFLYLLISLLCIILLPFVDVFASQQREIINAVLFNGTLILGLYICTNSFPEFIAGVFLGFFAWLLLWLGLAYSGNVSYELFSHGTMLIYFVYLSYHLFRNIRYSKVLNKNLIFAAIAGFLLIGFMGGQLINMLEALSPNSFKDIGTSFYNPLYFSFISLTSVGFGDITPLSNPAKSLSIIIGISGQMYLTIILGIIVGKYVKE